MPLDAAAACTEADWAPPMAGLLVILFLVFDGADCAVLVSDGGNGFPASESNQACADGANGFPTSDGGSNQACVLVADCLGSNPVLVAGALVFDGAPRF